MVIIKIPRKHKNVKTIKLYGVEVSFFYKDKNIKITIEKGEMPLFNKLYRCKRTIVSPDGTKKTDYLNFNPISEKLYACHKVYIIGTGEESRFKEIPLDGENSNSSVTIGGLKT
jgi:hypothetical protein